MFPAHQGVEAWKPEVWSARRGQARSRLWRWLEEPGLRSSCRPDNIGPSALMNPARVLSDSGCYLVLPGPSFSSRSVNGFGRNIALGVRRRYVPNAVRRYAAAEGMTRSPALVPAGTAVRRVSDGFGNFARRSCRSLFEAELHPVTPHTVQHRGELTRDGNERLPPPNPFGQGAAP
jgi:hypothetical protein